MSERQFQAVLQEHLRRAFEAEAKRAQRDVERARMYRPQVAHDEFLRWSLLVICVLLLADVVLLFLGGGQ